MENNKQSSVEMMWDEIDNLFPYNDPVEAQKFCALLDKYKAMHRQEIIDSFGVGCQVEASRLIGYHKMAEQYYNETFGGNNEYE